MVEKKRETLSEKHERFIDSILSHIPSDIVEHLGNSKKEMLLALRSLIDKAIEKIDEKIKRSKGLHKEE